MNEMQCVISCSSPTAEKTVSFRGRGLRGAELSCPQGYAGLVLKEVNPNGSDQEVNKQLPPPFYSADEVWPVRSAASPGVCVCLCVQDRTVKVSSMFDKLTYWNLETPPNSDDTVVMAMDWPELAEAVSSLPYKDKIMSMSNFLISKNKIKTFLQYSGWLLILTFRGQGARKCGLVCS